MAGPGEFVGSTGVMDEGSRSDVANVHTFARRNRGDYIMTGMQADWMYMF